MNGVIGVRCTLAEGASDGSFYLDDASWPSTGTGDVEGERLLVRNDEFDGSSLNDDNRTRLVLPAYAFNAEMQRYTTSTDNADVRDGALVITARQESAGSITSARLNTDGKAKWT